MRLLRPFVQGILVAFCAFWSSASCAQTGDVSRPMYFKLHLLSHASVAPAVRAELEVPLRTDRTLNATLGMRYRDHLADRQVLWSPEGRVAWYQLKQDPWRKGLTRRSGWALQYRLLRTQEVIADLSESEASTFKRHQHHFQAGYSNGGRLHVSRVVVDWNFILGVQAIAQRNRASQDLGLEHTPWQWNMDLTNNKEGLAVLPWIGVDLAIGIPLR